MKVGDLIDFLNIFDADEEVEIEVYETISGKYVDTTAALEISDI